MAELRRYVSDLKNYTDELPVLTKELLDGFDLPASNMNIDAMPRLSSLPDVFDGADFAIGNFSTRNRNLRVWRPHVQPKVYEFVECALELLGDQSTSKLPGLIANDNGRATLYDGTKITTDSVSIPYISVGIRSDLVEAFATHFLDCLEKVLSHLPDRTQLDSFTINQGAAYRSYRRLISNEHSGELEDTLSLHFSEPGTPYLSSQLNPRIAYRTQAGDISIHGKSAPHGFATSVPEDFDQPRPRFYVAYKLKPAC